ncbi:cytochrome P450, partial [Truncatella angustata]
WIVRGIYNIYFHQLSGYPGPTLAAASDWWYARSYTSGHWHDIIQSLHQKYGPVVRIAPNDLSFSTPSSYKVIYGHATNGRKLFLKSEFYDLSHGRPDIVSARDPAEHSVQRRSLAHAFSAKSLREQEDIVQAYLDKFVEKMGELGGTEEGVNVTEAYNWLTFDIIGKSICDLAFGESFEAVEKGESHFWVSLILGSFYIQTLASIRKRIPLFSLLLPFFVPPSFPSKFQKHKALTLEKTRKRIAMGDTGRADFFSRLLRTGKDKGAELDIQYLANQSNILIVAGSETTATFLAGATYFLLRNKPALAKLQTELRSTFSEFSQITGDSVTPLPYLGAVIEEGLRLFPPAGFGLPRICPGATIDGYYIPAGTTVSTDPFTMTRDPANWEQPDSFLPERWLPGGIGGGKSHDNKAASQPFSLGPRSCLGINLARVEARLTLAKLAWKYEWDLAESSKNLDWWRDMRIYTLWMKPELRVVFRNVDSGSKRL